MAANSSFDHGMSMLKVLFAMVLISMSSQAPKKLGLLVCRPEAIESLSGALTGRGWVIVYGGVLADDSAELSALNDADAIVVDLSGAASRQLQNLNELVCSEQRPVLFNDSSQDDAWLQPLHIKLEQLLGPLKVDRAEHSEVSPAEILETVTIARAEPAFDTSGTSESGQSPSHIWLLSASLGGPQVLKDFFLKLSAELPVSFLVKQRIGADYMETLANYLRQYSNYSVSLMGESCQLVNGNIVLLPDGACFSIADENVLLAERSSQCNKHELDLLLTLLAEHYGQCSGAIILSAVGADGVIGCEQMMAKGGRVWLHNDVPSYFGKLVTEYGEGEDRVLVESAPSLAEEFNRLYS